MTQLISKSLLLAFCMFFASCATQLPVATGIKEISPSDYRSLVSQKTQRKEVYDGLYNQMTLAATRMDGEMSEAYLAHSARLLQWNLTQYQDEKAKWVSKGTQSTDFFVSLYTPERKHNDLSSSKSIWKIYLDVNGQRYEGKAVKMKGQLTEIQTMFPEHNRWSNAYMVSFPIAAALSEGKPATLTITGTVTSTQLSF